MGRGLIPMLLAWLFGGSPKPRAEAVRPVCLPDPAAEVVYRDLSRPYRKEGGVYRISCLEEKR